MRRYYLVILLIVLSSCQSSLTHRVYYDYGDEFELSLGEEVRVGQENTVVQFLNVLEDSRCPINVTCVWAGNGKVQIRIDSREFHLNTYLEPRDTTITNRMIKLLSLIPYPEYPEQIDKADYRIRLQITTI